jgi:hypothetical protein
MKRERERGEEGGGIPISQPLLLGKNSMCASDFV